MSVNIFGKTNVGSSQRVISGGVTLSQAINTFLRRDGKNAAAENINMDSHNLINVLNPINAQDAATKSYVDKHLPLAGGTLTGILEMSSNKISGVGDPSTDQDAATKHYVDTHISEAKENISVPCLSGYIPILEGNVSVTGFRVSSSAILGDTFQPYHAFNNLTDNGWATPGSGSLEIECPESVKIWKVALMALKGKTITKWEFEGSKNAREWRTLLHSKDKLYGTSSAVTYFSIPPSTTIDDYTFYRLTISSSISTEEIGIQYMQMYALSN
jgi:hypothetical protein